jgi:trehalose 6-phosphate synthase
LVTALKPGATAFGGLWMGWSGRCVAAAERRLSLGTRANVDYAWLDLTAPEYRHHYAGFCNQTLWPLLHGLTDWVRGNPEDYRAYRSVNRLFAWRLAPLLQPDDCVWIHDYHLIPLGAELRALGVRNRVGFFLHTPCPSPAAWRALPMHGPLLASLRAYDLIGVQTALDADGLRRLLTAVARAPAAEFVASRIGVFSASIATGVVAAHARACDDGMHACRPSPGCQRVLGVDRLDPAKGIDRRLAGFDAFLRDHPDRHGRTELLQVIPDSRRGVPGYQRLRARLNARAAAINARYRQPGWVPVHTMMKGLAAPALIGLYRAARVALLTPLRDGMNLVAKEYVAAQDPDDPGVLILSRHAGAARELAGAILVDPKDTEQIAHAIERALTLSLPERRQRWSGMYRHLLTHDALGWYADFVSALNSAPCARLSGIPRP